MSTANTFDELNELIDRSFEIIREGLESADTYTQMKTAIDLTQMLVIAGFSKRVEAVERWADQLETKDGKEAA